MTDLWKSIIGLTFLILGFVGIVASIELGNFKVFPQLMIILACCIISGLGADLLTQTLISGGTAK